MLIVCCLDPIPGVSPLPSSINANSGSSQPSLYPRLPEVSLNSHSMTSAMGPNVSVNRKQSSPGRAAPVQQSKQQNKGKQFTTDLIMVGLNLIHSVLSSHSDGDMSRFDRLRRILGLSQSQKANDTQPTPGIIVDLDELRKECWLGIPHKIRPLAWRLLSVYFRILFLYF